MVYIQGGKWNSKYEWGINSGQKKRAFWDYDVKKKMWQRKTRFQYQMRGRNRGQIYRGNNFMCFGSQRWEICEIRVFSSSFCGTTAWIMRNWERKRMDESEGTRKGKKERERTKENAKAKREVRFHNGFPKRYPSLILNFPTFRFSILF